MKNEVFLFNQSKFSTSEIQRYGDLFAHYARACAQDFFVFLLSLLLLKYVCCCITTVCSQKISDGTGDRSDSKMRILRFFLHGKWAKIIKNLTKTHRSIQHFCGIFGNFCPKPIVFRNTAEPLL